MSEKVKVGRGREKGVLLLLCFGRLMVSGGAEKVVVSESGGAGGSWGLGSQEGPLGLGGFHGLRGDDDCFKDLTDVVGLSFSGVWLGEGGGLFLGVGVFLRGVPSAAMSCRSCWTALEGGGGKL